PKHQFDSVKVEAIAYRDASVLLALPEQEGYGFDALIGGQAPSVHQDLVLGHTLLGKVIAPHAGLRILRVASTAPGSDDQRRKALLLEAKGVVEAGFKNRGRCAVILRGPKDD